MGLPFRGSFGMGGITANAGTVINCLIPPRKNSFSIITTLRYSNGGTTQGHTLTFLKPVGVTTVTSATTAGQKVVPLVADPSQYLGPNGSTSGQTVNNPTSAGDYLVFELPDGTFYFDTANSTVTTVVTMSTNLPTRGLAAGAKVWNLKVTGQKDPWTGIAFPTMLAPFQIALNTVGEYTIQDIENGLVRSNQQYQPMIVQSNNISVAGTIDWISGVYSVA